MRGDLPVVMCALHQGELARSATLLQQPLWMQRDAGNQAGMAECFCGFAMLALTQVQTKTAARLFGAAVIEAQSDMPNELTEVSSSIFVLV